MRRINATALVAELDAVFGEITHEWGDILNQHNVWWA
jgi:hypothetical protein